MSGWFSLLWSTRQASSHCDMARASRADAASERQIQPPHTAAFSFSAVVTAPTGPSLGQSVATALLER
jgi:hypothetical protein